MSTSAIVRAVATRIAAHASIESSWVTVELDEQAPAVSGDIHITVMAGGTERGPTHDVSGCVIDKLYGVDVSVILRSPKRPRDRKRGLFIDLSDSHETILAMVEEQIDFDYTTLSTANALILAESASSQGFIEPLKFRSNGPFRIAPAEIFAGVPGGSEAAVVRRTQFRGARRIVTRS